MIRFVVDDLPAVPWVSGSQAALSAVPTGIPAVNSQQGLGSFILSPDEAISPLVYERRIGSLVQGTEEFGDLRDKDVRHLDVSADIQFPAAPFERSTIDGINRYKDSSGNWIWAKEGHFMWFSDATSYWEVPSQSWWASGVQKYYAGSQHAYAHWAWNGDKGLFVVHCYKPPIKRVSNDQVLVPATESTSMGKYRRSGSEIFFHGTANQASYTTSSEEDAVLASIPSSGGTSLPGKGVVQTSIGTPEYFLDQLAVAAAARIHDIDLMYQEAPVDFGDLGLECAKQKKFIDANMMLVAIDVADWRSYQKLWKRLSDIDEWRLAKSLYHKLVNHNASFKVARKRVRRITSQWSNAYLQEKYGVLPNVTDAQRLVRMTQRLVELLQFERLHSRTVTSVSFPALPPVHRTSVLTVECAQYPTGLTGMIQALIAGWKEFGMYPNVETLWDIVPLSFVVDWFVQFGDLFEDVDNYLDMENYFPVREVVMSDKWEVVLDITTLLPDFPVPGDVAFSYYVRWISREIPFPAVSLEVDVSAYKHVLESTALILQRL